MVRRWLQKLTPQRRLALVLGWCTTLVGAGAFVALMGLGLAPLIANTMCKLATTQVRFTIHRRTRPGAQTLPLWRQWRRYQCQKGITALVNCGLFLVTTVVEIPYLAAYALCVLLVKPLSGFIAEKYTFTD